MATTLPSGAEDCPEETFGALEYRNIIDALPAMIAQIDPGHRYRFANAAYREFFQLNPESIAGRSVSEALGKGAYETIRPHLERALAGEPVAFESSIRGRDHTERYCRMSFVPRQARTGEIVGAYVLVSNLTKLKNNERRYQRLLESTGAIPWEADARTWQFTYVGRQAEEILGYAIEEWYEQDFWPRHIHPDDRAYAIGFCEESSRRMTDYEFEYRMKCADGRVVWLHDIVNVETRNGEPVALRGYMIDITPRKQAEKDLRAAHVELEERVRQATAANDALKVEIAQRRQTEQELSRALAEVASLQRKLELENRYLSSEVRRQLGDDEIIEQSDAMKAVLAQAAQVASTRSSVLVLGETGVGKEVLARWIHDHSPRRDHPMVKVNCAALPSSLIEAELFGREKGAYTGAMTRQTGRFEIADGSTIFLDEIGDLAPEVQTKLLTVLQDGELQRLGSAKTISVDVRIIAATNRDLAEALEAGKFRSDLYYRLNVFPIVVPPLRERVDDIPALVWTFVKELRETMGKPIEHIAPESMIALQQYAWPGNVRELRNVVERAMIVADGPMMHIPVPVQASDAPLKGTSLQVVERDHIVQTLIRTSWRVRGEQGAAKLLGLKPTTLEARMKKLGIQRPQKTQSDRRTSNIS